MAIRFALGVSIFAFAELLTTAPLMAAAQNVIVNQQGATNPASNGFALNVGGDITSQGPVGTAAWNVQGDWCCSSDWYYLSSSQITELATATNWAFIATYQNLSPSIGPGYFGYPCGYGSYAVIQVNGVRFDLAMHSDRSGNQVLCLDAFTGSTNYTIAGLGTNYVTLEVLYNNSTRTANIFVDGKEVISNYAGHAPLPAYTGNFVIFGGENGTFIQVELQTNAPTPSALPVTRILPQLAFGGGWYTALYFTNTNTAPVSVTVSFTGNDGNPLTIPALGGPSATVNLAARGTALIEAPNMGSLVQGYVTAALPTGAAGYGVFRQSVPGVPDQEAVVPLSGNTATTSTLLFDDTKYVTGVAVVNLASVNNTITATARDNQGNTLGTGSIPLGPNAKTALVLRNIPGLASVVGAIGSVDFTATIGNVAALGLRFNGTAFTSIPTSDR